MVITKDEKKLKNDGDILMEYSTSKGRTVYYVKDRFGFKAFNDLSKAKTYSNKILK